MQGRHVQRPAVAVFVDLARHHHDEFVRRAMDALERAHEPVPAERHVIQRF